MKCFAKQFNDMNHCDICSKTWNVNDPNPPACEPQLGDLINYVQILQDRIDDLTTGYNLLRERLMHQNSGD